MLRSAPPKAIPVPSTPKAKARSLLPMGPSYRREAPASGPITPAYSLMTALTTTSTTSAGDTPGNRANGRYSAASATTSHSSLR